MGRVKHDENLISAVKYPCPISPKSDYHNPFRFRLRTQISRTQVAAVGIMSLTMIAILVISFWPMNYIPPPSPKPAKYNTASVLVRFHENGEFIRALNVSIANSTSNRFFDYESTTIVKCRSSGYALVAPIFCYKNGSKTWGVHLCRLDDFGNIVWDHTFDEIDFGLDLSLVEDHSGGFAVAGTTRSIDEDSNAWIGRVFLLRTDRTGVHQRTVVYDELSGVQCHSLIECDNGDFAVVGTTEANSISKNDVMLARMDENGTLLWNHPIGGPMIDQGNALLESDDGGFIVVGSTENEYKDFDVLIMKTSANGSQVWNKTHEDEGNSMGWAVCSLENGGFAVTGLRKPTQSKTSATLLLVTDSDGIVVRKKSLKFDSWLIPYGYYDECTGHAILQSRDGGFIIAGIVRQNSWNDEWDMMVLRMDASGSLLWNSTYGGNSWATGCALVSCDDGGFAVAGVKTSLVG